jgi:hypothetical protein
MNLEARIRGELGGRRLLRGLIALNAVMIVLVIVMLFTVASPAQSLVGVLALALNVFAIRFNWARAFGAWQGERVNR